MSDLQRKERGEATVRVDADNTISGLEEASRALLPEENFFFRWKRVMATLNRCGREERRKSDHRWNGTTAQVQCSSPEKRHCTPPPCALMEDYGSPRMYRERDDVWMCVEAPLQMRPGGPMRS
mmetsp:Transcript_25732/g.51204  ORF Transcript_25732/g.51204 Transcript_25732/m.51204 type:complete len:123 (+) Transcript_25732:528-896(+)